MKYKAVIFDFDYTLADATPAIVECANHALASLGFAPADKESIRKTVGMTLSDAFAVFTGITDKELTGRFLDEFKTHADLIMTANTTLLPGAAETLAQLKNTGIKTGIVTSKLHYRIDEVLNRFNIPHLVDYIVGYEDVESPKPSPEGLLNAINHFGLDKSEVLYVGDSIIDAKTAQNAGVDFTAVTTGTTAADDFAKLPNVAVIGGLSDLPAL